jgi:hypothetical protein
VRAGADLGVIISLPQQTPVNEVGSPRLPTRFLVEIQAGSGILEVIGATKREKEHLSQVHYL